MAVDIRLATRSNIALRGRFRARDTKLLEKTNGNQDKDLLDLGKDKFLAALNNDDVLFRQFIFDVYDERSRTVFVMAAERTDLTAVLNEVIEVVYPDPTLPLRQIFEAMLK